MDSTRIHAFWPEDLVGALGIASSLPLAVCVVGLVWALLRQTRLNTAQSVKLEAAEASVLEARQMLCTYATMSIDRFWEQDAAFRFQENGFGLPSAQSDNIGKTLWEIAGSAMTETAWGPHKAALAAREKFRNFSWEQVDQQGRRRIWTVNGDPMFDRNGVFSGYRGTSRDITVEVKGKERRLLQAKAEIEARVRLAQANDELELGRQQFDAVLNNISQGVCFFDGNKRLQLWNRRYAEIYGLTPDALGVGRSLAEIVNDRQQVGSTPETTLPIILPRATGYCRRIGPTTQSFY